MLEKIINFWNKEIVNDNTLQDFLIAILVFLSVSLIITVLRRFLEKWLIKRENAQNTPFIESIIASVRKRLLPITYIFALYAALYYLRISTPIINQVDKAVGVVLAFFILLFITDAVRAFFVSYKINSDFGLPPSIVSIINFIIWAVGTLFIFANLGYNVSTFITGLGIGGVAIALASQAILGDLFNYFVILFDKPFQKGDNIQIDDILGTVEYIGIKSTRIRSANGEMLLISNTDLTKSRIRNYRAAEKRRCLVTIGVEYATPVDKLKQIPDILKKTVESIPDTEFSRVHFSDFAASSLNFELAYFVQTNDYPEYAKTVQAVNFKIVEEFQKLGVNFAFPTQTIYIAKN